MSVASEDRSKTAFMAPMGKFEFTRMPFGLKGAPTTFQRLMDVILSPCTRFARAYQDDIVIFSESWEEHLEHLEEVFRRLEEAGLKAKSSKCVIAADHCSYLGHIVGHGQIVMEEAKLEALRNFRRPLCKKDVRAFLGLAGYYRSVQYKELKLGSHSGHAKTNLSGHCVKMSGHYFLKVTPILKYMKV